MEPEIHYIYINDIQLHSNKIQNPVPWYTKVIKTITSRKYERFYSDKIEIKEDGIFRARFDLSPELQEEKAKAEAQGKIVKFILPEGGAPVFLGDDAVEKLKAMKDRKRRSHGTRYFRNN